MYLNVESLAAKTNHSGGFWSSPVRKGSPAAVLRSVDRVRIKPQHAAVVVALESVVRGRGSENGGNSGDVRLILQRDHRLPVCVSRIVEQIVTAVEETACF